MNRLAVPLMKGIISAGLGRAAPQFRRQTPGATLEGARVGALNMIRHERAHRWRMSGSRAMAGRVLTCWLVQIEEAERNGRGPGALILALAAYDAGKGAVLRHRHVPLNRETRNNSAVTCPPSIWSAAFSIVLRCRPDGAGPTGDDCSDERLS